MYAGDGERIDFDKAPPETLRSQIKKLDNEERERILKDTKSIIRSYSYGAKCLHNWKKNMRIFTLTLAIVLLWFGSARAYDDHVGECEIVGWRWYYNIGTGLRVVGSTTCASGSVTIHLYEETGESKRSVGIAIGSIEGYIFIATPVLFSGTEIPQLLSIEYSIETKEGVVADPDVQCEIEEWQLLGGGDQPLRIVGRTTCVSGSGSVRLYEGKGESKRLYGIAMDTSLGDVFGGGDVFDANISVLWGTETPQSLSRALPDWYPETPPQSLSIEYRIETEEGVVADPDVQCKIEEWRWYYGGDFRIGFNIKGSTTCASGSVSISVYEGTGESKRLYGIAYGIIRGYAFSLDIFGIKAPRQSLSIEYRIY